LDPRKRKLKEDCENCILKNFIICALHQLLGRMRLAEHVTSKGEITNAYKILVGIP
jgi:hypothetical protein